MTDEGARVVLLARLRAENAKLREALENIVNVIGPGTCNACKCEGCAWETGEAIRLAKAILGPQDAKQGVNPPETPVERATGHGSAGDGCEE